VLSSVAATAGGKPTAVTDDRRSTIPRSGLHPLPPGLLLQLLRNLHWSNQLINQSINIRLLRRDKMQANKKDSRDQVRASPALLNHWTDAARGVVYKHRSADRPADRQVACGHAVTTGQP